MRPTTQLIIFDTQEDKDSSVALLSTLDSGSYDVLSQDDLELMVSFTDIDTVMLPYLNTIQDYLPKPVDTTIES